MRTVSVSPVLIGSDGVSETRSGDLHPWLDPMVCNRARLSRDARFDGRFFTGVLTTRIYCRPICPVRPARSGHVRFFPSAAAAEQAGFRPCLRCRPELAPGLPTLSGPTAAVSRAIDLIHRGFLDERHAEDLGAAVGIGSRHLTRLFVRYLGAPPGAIARTRRLQTAKMLLSETTLPVTAIAFAAGFASIRRFNAAFVETYGSAPSRIRRTPPRNSPNGHSIALHLGFRAPLDWPLLRMLLEAEATPGVEEVNHEVNHQAYRRTVLVDGRAGWLEVRPAARGNYMVLSLSLPEYPRLRNVLAQVRRMFDLDADPVRIRQQLGSDDIAGPLMRTSPGVRIPGSWDGFEVAVRTLVAKHVTESRVRVVMGHLVRMHGRHTGLGPGHLFPTPAALANVAASPVLFNRLVADIRRLAHATVRRAIRFDPSIGFEDLVASLCRTAIFTTAETHWIAMRTLGEPDAAPFGSPMVPIPPQSVPSASIQDTDPWRPWRSYVAVLQSSVRLQRSQCQAALRER